MSADNLRTDLEKLNDLCNDYLKDLILADDVILKIDEIQLNISSQLSAKNPNYKPLECKFCDCWYYGDQCHLCRILTSSE